MMMKFPRSAALLPVLGLLAVGGCTAGQATTSVSSLTASAGTTVPLLAQALPAKALADGQLFCQDPATKVAVAVGSVAGGISVIGMTSDAVAAICAGLGAVPAPAPMVTVAVPTKT